MRQDFVLCGTMFGLEVKDSPYELWRHRWFETSGFYGLTPQCQHHRLPMNIGGGQKPERKRAIEHMQFVFEPGGDLGKARAPFHQGRGDQADHEGGTGADRDHDQNRADRPWNPEALEKAQLQSAAGQV